MAAKKLLPRMLAAGRRASSLLGPLRAEKSSMKPGSFAMLVHIYIYIPRHTTFAGTGRTEAGTVGTESTMNRKRFL